MGGYLDTYGAGEAKRERVLHRIALWTGIVLAVAVIVWFTLYFVIPNRSEQARVNRFFELLAAKDYKQAYALWGCTDAQPCRGYPFQSFMQDWGPQAIAVAGFDVLSGESCGSGVIVDVDAGKAGNKKLWVERKNGNIGFPPPNVVEVGRCPQGNRIYDFVRDLKYKLHGRTYR